MRRYLRSGHLPPAYPPQLLRRRKRPGLRQLRYAKTLPNGSTAAYSSKALSAIFRTGEFVGMNSQLSISSAAQEDQRSRKKGYDKLKTYGAGKDPLYKEWKEYLYQMLQLGYIEIDYVNAGILKVTPLGRKVLFGEQKAMMAIYKEPEEKTLFQKKRLEIQIPPHQTHPIGFGRRDTARLAPATPQADCRTRTDTSLHHLF